VDITDGIPKDATLNFCRGCERFLSPPQTWVAVQPESRELLGKRCHPGRMKLTTCTFSHLLEEDCETITESATDRRFVHMDRTSL
jgi:predicted Fe-S protein YdhL (DUF1289 family)